MKENKNIIKGDKFAETNAVTKHSFYAVIDIKVKSKDGSANVKSLVKTAVGTRMEAKNELEVVAKEVGGTISHFGGFRK